MTRRRFLIRTLGVGLFSAALLHSVSGVAQQTKPDPKWQQALNRALILAVRKHDVKAVRSLLAQGADANARDAARPNRKGSVKPPFTKDPPTTLLIAFDDSTLSTGRWVNGELKTTPRPDPCEVVKALLEKGADPNVMDYDQSFPLLIAVQNKYTASARLLLEHGAKVNQTWLHGITPLHIAVGNKDVPTVKLLVQKGADVTMRSAFDDPAHPLETKVQELLASGGG